MSSNKETKRSAYGMRLRFYTNEDGLCISTKMYSDGKKLVRAVVDKKNMRWSIVDAATGFVYAEGGEGITNYEVLLRHVKKHLIKMLNIPFEKEERNAGKYIHLISK
jgi:hypothetical protein